jgi:hypothetical protein
LGDIENVFPIEEVMEITFLTADKTGLMCPWDSFDANMITQNYDVMFGHFEFKGAVLKGAVHDSGESMETLTSVSPLVFSGHFHIRKEYPQKTGKVVTIGSPVELDWGDCDNTKGFYVLHPKDMSYDFYENDFSPRHIKIYFSKLKARKEKLTNVQGNYIKFVVDDKYKFEHVMKILNAINLKNPIKPAETDFIYNNNFNSLLDQMDFKPDEKMLSMSKLDYIKSFIDHVEDNLQDLDKNTLVGMCTEYYNLTMDGR